MKTISGFKIVLTNFILVAMVASALGQATAKRVLIIPNNHKGAIYLVSDKNGVKVTPEKPVVLDQKAHLIYSLDFLKTGKSVLSVIVKRKNGTVIKPDWAKNSRQETVCSFGGTIIIPSEFPGREITYLFVGTQKEAIASRQRINKDLPRFVRPILGRGHLASSLKL